MVGQDEPPVFTKAEKQKVAQMAWEAICTLENQPQKLPGLAHLQKPEIQAALVKAVEELQPSPEQMALEGFTEKPDFVAETMNTILMLEPKASNQMDDPIVLAKKEAALEWCSNASKHTESYGGKPWRYVLIPHNAVTANMTLDALVERFK